MQVSATCRSFVEHVCANRWRDAVIFANGLNMYEMLRAFKALDASDIANFRIALAANAGAVNAPRMEYALSVVETGKVPASAPGDLDLTGQVNDARQFVARPRSILQEPVPTTALTGFNASISSVSNAFMLRTLGSPRSSFGPSCQPIDNRALQRRVATRSVGPFTATGLDSALDSLTAIMSDIGRDLRIVHRVLGTAGMLCARFVRGSTTNISNHSWGTAIDITVGGALDVRGDNSVQFGLQLIAPKFNAAGWFWGMEFPTEDGMHFEGGQALVATWASP
jgi:hypothetical protein